MADRAEKKRREGKLSKERIRRLDEIGMIWEYQDGWETGYEHARRHAERTGDCNVSSRYVSPDRYALGRWISNQRNTHNNPRKDRRLTADQVSRLEKIGMVWSPNEESWKNGYRHAVDYHEKYGNLHLSSAYVSPDGFKLGTWVRDRRRRAESGSLGEDRRSLLRLIGIR